MDKSEREKIIDEVIDAVRSETWSWFESDIAHQLRCNELRELANKLKNKSVPTRAILLHFRTWLCPYCKEEIGLEYECTKCGQKILWGKKENLNNKEVEQ